MVTSDPCSALCSPHYSILGRISDTDVYRDVAQYQMVTAPGGGRRAACNFGGGGVKALPGAVCWGNFGGRFWGVEGILRKGGKGSMRLHPWGSTLPVCPQAQEVPGVKIFCSSSTLYFANVELYAEALKKKVGELPDPLVLPVPLTCRHQVGSGAPGAIVLHCFAEWHRRGPPDQEEEEGSQEAEETAEKSREGEGKEEKGAPCCKAPVWCHPALSPCQALALLPVHSPPGSVGHGVHGSFWGTGLEEKLGQSRATASHPGSVGESQAVND